MPNTLYTTKCNGKYIVINISHLTMAQINTLTERCMLTKLWYRLNKMNGRYREICLISEHTKPYTDKIIQSITV